MPTLNGFLEKITYFSEESGFVVAKLQETGKKELTTIVGPLAGVTPGESLRLEGRWVHHKRFGEQFQVDRYEMTTPATVNGLRKYLGSGLIKGIGPVMADRIVDRFNLSALEILDGHPERLSEVDGIGPKRAAQIIQAWREQQGIKDVMIFLQGHGVGAAFSARIYRHYGDRAIEVVRSNPYRLAQEIQGIGFLTADRIAQNLGIEPTSPFRARAGLLYVLNEAASEGHVCLPDDEIVRRAGDVLNVDAGLLGRALDEAAWAREVVVEPLAGEAGRRAVFALSLHTAETGVARSLRALLETPSPVRPIRPEKAIEWLEEKLRLTLAPEQREAVLAASRSKVLVITGGPGTGKTTIITAVLGLFRQLRLRILLGAPTGRAAKKMGETTGWEAKTLHRLLEYTPQTGGFRKGPNEPLDADVVIVDETSMVDTVLMYHLLRAVPPKAHLILVGDVDQLPSVGPGNVLRDLIESAAVPVVRLSEIFRQARQSLIVVNAHRINQGALPVLRSLDDGEKGDFFFVEEEEPERVLKRILSLSSEVIPTRFGFDPVREIQVLTPMNRGLLGTENLNAELRKRLNPGPAELVLGSREFKTGDKAMQIVNNYDKEVFNGDIGRITRIDPEKKEVTIDFDGRSIRYDGSDLGEIVPAYAISVHKSQGSEYPAIILPVSTQHYVLLQKNLLYTGMTRARRLAVLVGTTRALGIALRNNRPDQRYTRLAWRLKSDA